MWFNLSKPFSRKARREFDQRQEELNERILERKRLGEGRGGRLPARDGLSRHRELESDYQGSSMEGIARLQSRGSRRRRERSSRSSRRS